MLAGALGTYSAALIVVVASIAIGAGVCAAGGAKRWTWTAPAVGLAAATVLAWWAVRLPGHGLTALAVLAVATAAGGALAWRRMEGLGEAAARGAPAFAVVLVAVSIPFGVEGHFGILGTGFNVDMSQHLFAASWLADPAGAAPGLFGQGYPLGPHALAVATGEVSGELATSFSGVTIAVPMLLALAALGACEGISRRRATAAAALAALAYLGASYFAQGSFKELYEAAFVVGFALWLSEAARGAAGRTWRTGLPPAVLAAGALYAYSGPGLAWLAGTLVLWGLLELTVGSKGTNSVPNQPTGAMGPSPATMAARMRTAAPALLAGLLTLAVLAAPELDRIADFGGSVGTVSDRAESADPVLVSAPPQGTDQVQIRLPPRRDEGPKFDNDLGNLFGQISPLEAFGVWPSGDFRVAPGDGAVPAVIFYAGALLGALALAAGLAATFRRGETALLAALTAAVAIWLVARVASTPYTTAKALEMIAPLAMLIAARGVLDPTFLARPRAAPAFVSTALAAAFIAAAALSSGLVLANTPVGPREYSPGVTALSAEFAARSTLLLAPAEVIADEHGREFYGWELREASSVGVRDESAGGGPAPAGFSFVLTVDGGAEAPYEDVATVSERNGVTLWRVDPPAPPG